MNTIDQQIQDEILKRLADSSLEWQLIQEQNHIGIECTALALRVYILPEVVVVNVGEIGCALDKQNCEQLITASTAKQKTLFALSAASAKQAILTALTQ